jgi:hypothetical protein
MTERLARNFNFKKSSEPVKPELEPVNDVGTHALGLT